VIILPYMEQVSLAEGYVNWGGNDTTGVRYAAGANLNVTRTRLPTLTCPTDESNSPLSNITNHNYVVNYGNTSFFQTTQSGVRFQGAPFNAYSGSTSADSVNTTGASPPPNNPMGKPVPLAEILDGTSNTLLASEVIQGKGRDLRGFSWWGGGSGFVAWISPNSSEPDVMLGSGFCGPPTIDPPCTLTSTASTPRRQGARSRHPGGVNAALADGHVVFITNSISLNVWRAASTSRGSEPTQLGL
jgi:prepilin-type processing-associated H-X9-DG protein